MHFLALILLALTQWADYLTTNHAIRTNKGRESNAVMIRLIAKWGIQRAFFYKGLAVVALGLALELVGPYTSLGLTMVYAIVDLRNWWIGR